MFETIIKELQKELDTLHINEKKCYELKQRSLKGDTKDRLERKHLELCQAVDRAALCLDILNYRTTLEISKDWKTVRLV